MQFQPRNATEAKCTLTEVNSDSRNLPCESNHNYQTGLSVSFLFRITQDKTTSLFRGLKSDAA